MEEVLVAAVGADEHIIMLGVEALFGHVVKGKHQDDNPELGGR